MSASDIGPDAPSAKQRLQATRQALMHELVPSTRPDRKRGRAVPVQETPGMQEEPMLRDARLEQEEHDDDQNRPSGWWSVAKHSVHAWWEFHPVRAAGAVAEPVLAEYARRSPWKTIGIAAGVGAVVVVTRPWRLVSLGGLAIAALKSSQMSNLALSFLSSRRNK